MRHLGRIAGACALVLLTTGLAAAATPDDCRTLRKHGHRAEAQFCYQSLAQARDAYLRAEGDWGLERYDEANNEFRAAVAQSPANPFYRVRWGRLLHERFNNSDAEALFEEALQRDPHDAQAFLGKALVSADGFDEKALQWAAQAIVSDPKLVEAHELMAKLHLEDSNTPQAIEEADKAIGLSPDALDAMAIRAALELLADRSPDAWLDKIKQVNPTYGEAYAQIGFFLVFNRRYDDGVAYYRQAIALDPQLWSAHSELGINLMRLGQFDEPRAQLELAYNHGYRDAATVNSLRLLDSYKNFVTFKDDTTILKLHKNEADLLRPYFQNVLKRSMATYEKKYKMKLPGPVQVEVYPDHEDFAVRTLGMPGLGALGVTFGEVVAMDSPSGRKPGDFNWASTLWHEMSHVYILTATNHRVPRWFTEGLAVHEETEADPEWGDRITPDILVAIKNKKLLPVADLDRGFVRPDYPNQVIVSYFQAGRICDYIQSRWGADKLLDMVHSFAQIRHHAGRDPAESRHVRRGIRQAVHGLAAPRTSARSVDNFDQWRAALKELVQLDKDKDWDGVIKKGEEVRSLYPQYVYDANAYEFIAEADLAKNDKKAAAAILTGYEKMGGRDPGALKQLASLEKDLDEPKEAAATLDRINYIYPDETRICIASSANCGSRRTITKAPSANTPPSWP